MGKEKVKIEEYIELHNAGIPLSKVRPIANQTFKTLAKCNVDIRIIDREKNLNRLYKLEQLSTFTKDTKEISRRYFYSIPVQTINGTIVGFIYRTVFGKAYTTVSREFSDKEHKVPLMFGFFKDFENYDENDRCKPIVVCEGLKDCITLKKIYPYVLSNNTSHMGVNLQVLSNLTNKFILIYDNDKAGEDGMKEDIERAQKMKYDIIQMKLSKGYKDITDCEENSEYFQNIKNSLLDSIDKLDRECIGTGYIGRTYDHQ